MKTYTLYKPDNDKYKYKIYVVDENGKIKKIEFGANGYSDFTQHKNEERRQRYITRHYSRENWNDYTTKGYWSYWILWNKPTIQESYKDVIKRFNLKPEGF